MSIFLPIQKDIEGSTQKKLRKAIQDFDAKVALLQQKRKKLFEETVKKTEIKKMEALQKRYGKS